MLLEWAAGTSQTANPKPQTPNPEPQILNPEPCMLGKKEKKNTGNLGALDQWLAYRAPGTGHGDGPEGQGVCQCPVQPRLLVI